MKQTIGKMMGAKAWTLLLFALFALLPKAAMAQKFALIDMEYVLKNVPAYERANEQLNQVSKKWQAEVEALTTEAGTMYKNYRNEVVFLSEEQKKKRQEDIMAKEKQASDLKRKYFGPEGELFKKRTSLMTPIQEEIYTAVKDIADQRGYSLVIDRSSDSAGIIYGSPKIDISNEVLRNLAMARIDLRRNNNNNIIKLKEKMKKLLIALMLCAPMTMFAQKFGHIDSQALLMSLPEAVAVQNELQAKGNEYQKQLEDMQKELQTKAEAYDKAKATMPTAKQEETERELNDMYRKIQQTAQDNQKAFNDEQQRKLGPLLDKVRTAIASVAKAGGYVYIMEKDGGQPLYINDTISKDITVEVKAELAKMK